MFAVDAASASHTEALIVTNADFRSGSALNVAFRMPNQIPSAIRVTRGSGGAAIADFRIPLRLEVAGPVQN